MIRSMTAFARAEKTDGSATVGIEIRSYNHRYLDVVARLPHGLQELEENIRTTIGSHLARGRVEIKVHLTEQTDTELQFELNAPLAQAYVAVLRELQQHCELEDPITLDHLLRTGDIIKPKEAEKDLAAREKLVRACLTDALQLLVAMRNREGDALAADLNLRLDAIKALLDQIDGSSSGMLEVYRDRLNARISALASGVVEIDPARVIQEAAILAERSDISEELVRSRSHIDQFESLMAADEPAGRKLNFLLQELHRELNTIGSKTQKSEVSHFVVAAKSELEKIREQVQNIE